MAVMDRPAPFGRQDSLSPSRQRPYQFGRPSPLGGLETTIDPNDAERPRDRVRDLSALAMLAAGIFVVAALATFSPADPPAARVFPPNAKAVNACGLIGSTIASFLYQTFGLGAWFIVTLLAVFVGSLLRRKPLPDLPLRMAGAVVATAGVCTLLSMFLVDWVPRPLWGAGGYVGAAGQFFAESNLARTGGAILVAAATAAGLFLAADAIVLKFISAGCVAGLAVVAGSRSLLGRLRLPALGRRARNPEDASDVDAVRSSMASVERDDEDDEADDDDADEDAFEPTVRVKSRLRARDDDSLDDADDDVAADATDEAVEPDEPPSKPVPIRSLASRRKPATPVLGPELDPGTDYSLPSIDLLLPTEQLALEAQEQEVRDRARVLEKTFADFGFKVRVVEIETGPVISQYEIELEAGLRLAKISNLADDLAIALRVPSVRIVAPIPGKNSVGIEVPNTERQMVRLREVIEETQSKSRSMKIPIYLGKDVAGNPMVVDMASLPHLLIAGRTGTGKSVCLNSIIVSMLMTRRPDEVRMLMIDPKMVELTPYKTLPHLMHPVVTDMKKAEAILAWAVDKMEQRYALLAKVGVRHLSQYNLLGREELVKRIKPETEEEEAAIPTTMPYIVMIADEIADMMMTAGKEIEQHIIRLAQKSRAVGIHLILATQKPTVDVITGLIKSNLPARIAFQVASRTDSRVVLDEMGAERLLGNGDMLFLSPGTSQILRGQGTFVSDEEIGRVMATIGTSDPQYAAELVNLQPAPSGDAAAAGQSPKVRDDLYEQAVEVVIREGRGSVSLLQRALGVGYGRGARLIDFMAEDGVVGQYAGSQAREVLLTMEQWAERNGTTPPPADPPPRKLKIQPHADLATTGTVAPFRDAEQEIDEDDDEEDDFEEDEDDLEDESEDDSDDDTDEDEDEESDDEDEFDDDDR
jgi:S-DNA-T family DNA segregation ATPase FtsK/SpoIIIE